MKKLLVYGLIFAGLGTLLSTFVSPGMISWYFEPPVHIGVNCRPAVDWGIEKYQWAQLGGFVGGGIVGVIIFLALRPKNQTPASQ